MIHCRYQGGRSKLLFVGCIALVLNLYAVPGPAGEPDDDVPSAEELAWDQWGNSAWIALAESNTPWMRAALASHLATRDDPDLAAIGHQKFAAIAVTPTSDPQTLWHLARYCRAFRTSATCTQQQIIENLAEVDASNIATLLVADQHRSGEDGSTTYTHSSENQLLLGNLANAEFYEDFWGRGTGDLLQELEKYSRRNPPPEIPEVVKHLNVAPDLLLLFPIYSMEGYSPGFSKLSTLCQSQAAAGNQTAIKQCLAIATTLQRTSRTQLPLMIGLAIEEFVLVSAKPGSSDARFAELKRSAFRQANQCGIPHFLSGGNKVQMEWETLKILSTAYLHDLDRLGEMKAVRNAAEREYAMFPEHFPADPADCPDVLAMNPAQLAAFQGQNPGTSNSAAIRQ